MYLKVGDNYSREKKKQNTKPKTNRILTILFNVVQKKFGEYYNEN